MFFRILMRLFFAFLVALAAVTAANAQSSVKISGTVIDSLTSNPVEFANVALMRSGSSTPIDGTICDVKGEFVLRNVAPGTYLVQISFIGFETRTLPVTVRDRQDIALGSVIISPTQQLLEAVTVEGERALIEERVDRTIYNAENDLTSRGGDATDVLKRVPMLSVDLDGNVSLRGNQNILVLINNKPSSIVASSVADALKQIPAEEIKQVEVITSPSAKYDAEGSAGIINIITKKNTLRGATLNINSGIGLRGSMLGLNGNLRTGKMGFSLGGFGRGFYNTSGSFLNEQTTRAPLGNNLYEETLNVQRADTRNNGLFGSYNLGWDYDIDKKNSITASVRFGVRNNKTYQDDLTTERYVDDALVMSTLADNANRSAFNNIDASFNYTHYYDKPQRELSFQALFSRNNGNSYFENFVRDPSDRTLLSRFRNDNDGYNQELTFQVDYQTPVSTNQIIEFGAKNIMRSAFTEYASFRATGEGAYEPAVNDRFNNNLNYDQGVVAGYFAYTLALQNGVSVKVGARYEHTNIDAYSRTEDDIEIPSYGVLVPSVNVSRRLKSNNTLKASYNRRIQRPSIRYLNPNIERQNAIDVTVGNPVLAPEFTNNFELGYSTLLKGLMINFTGFARYTNDAIQSVRVPDEIDGESVIKTTFENIGKDRAYGSSIFLNANMGKLSLNGGGDVYYTSIDNNVPVDSLRASNEGFVVSGRIFGSYDLGKGWGAQLFSFYRGRQVQLQGTQGGFYMYSLGFRKEFNERKGSIGLAAENFLQSSMKIRTKLESPLVAQHRLNTRNNLSLRLTFTYRLGKISMDDQPRRRRRTISNDDLKGDGGGDAMQMGDAGMSVGQGGGRQRNAAQPQRPVAKPASQADTTTYEVAGNWTYSIEGMQGAGGKVEIRKTDTGFEGTLTHQRWGTIELQDVKVEGNEVSFRYPISMQGNELFVDVKGVVSADTMSGQIQMGGQRTVNFTATRTP